MPGTGSTVTDPQTRKVRLVAIFCLIEVLSMVGFGTVPALLPVLTAEWRLTNTGGGILTGAYFVGYMICVPVLVSLTDRRPAEKIYLFAIGLTILGMAGFIVLADGLWSGVFFHILCGAGLAGTYMPGLRMLSDRTEGPRQSRYIAFYTATFSAGAAVSYFATGLIGKAFGWPWAFAAGILGAAAAGALMLMCVRPMASGKSAAPPATALLDFRPILRNRAAMGYVLGYAAHMFELFAMRSWIVTFLTWVVAQSTGGAPLSVILTASTVAGLVALIGMPASVLGNEVAMLRDRRKTISFCMIASGTLAPLIALSGTTSYGVVVGLFLLYAIFVMADSSALTAGAIAAAPPGYRGATMALHSTLGFGGGFLGSFVPGLVLDMAGGKSAFGWLAAFAVIGLGVLLGPLALFLTRPRAPATTAQ